MYAGPSVQWIDKCIWEDRMTFFVRPIKAHKRRQRSFQDVHKTFFSARLSVFPIFWTCFEQLSFGLRADWEGRVVKPHKQIWKFKYCLMEIKLPLVANIWILDCLQYRI